MARATVRRGRRATPTSTSAARAGCYPRRMRVLGVGDSNDLGDLYLRLVRRGHEVRVCVEDPGYHAVLSGLVPRVARWEDELGWVRAAGEDGLVVFEDVRHGPAQDELRREGFQVVGGSALGDRLENDRAFGQEALRTAGLTTVASRACSGFDEALQAVRRDPRRWVVKLEGGYASVRSYVGELASGEDVLAALELQRATWPFEAQPRILAVASGHLREAELSTALASGRVGSFVALKSIDLAIHPGHDRIPA